jgi:hypothetical protein
MVRQTKNAARNVNPASEIAMPKVGSRIRPGSIVDKILRLSAQIPKEEWAKLPRDGSYNHDHYLYGTPKEK